MYCCVICKSRVKLHCYAVRADVVYQDEMANWIDRISKASGGASVEARTQTLPAASSTGASSLERKEDKKRGVFTLGKKK
jgi:hypothetical protein